MTDAEQSTDTWPLKTCAGCKNGKPKSEFYRHKGRSDGLTSRCKVCTSADNKRKCAANPEPAKRRAKARYESDVEKARAYNRENYKRNADALKEYQRRYRAENEDKVRQRGASYYQKNKDRLKAAFKEYRAANTDAFRRSNAKYRKNHPEAHRLRQAKRNAAKRQGQVRAITKHELLQRVEACGGKCVYCGMPWKHIDHVKPLAKGGPHILANIRPACVRCNVRKSDMDPMTSLATVPKSAPVPLP